MSEFGHNFSEQPVAIFPKPGTPVLRRRRRLSTVGRPTHIVNRPENEFPSFSSKKAPNRRSMYIFFDSPLTFLFFPDLCHRAFLTNNFGRRDQSIDFHCRRSLRNRTGCLGCWCRRWTIPSPSRIDIFSLFFGFFLCVFICGKKIVLKIGELGFVNEVGKLSRTCPVVLSEDGVAAVVRKFGCCRPEAMIRA